MVDECWVEICWYSLSFCDSFFAAFVCYRSNISIDRLWSYMGDEDKNHRVFVMFWVDVYISLISYKQ